MQSKTLVFVGTSDTNDVVELASRFGRVYLFEPLKELAQSLVDKMADHPHLRMFNAACGAEEGTRPFNVINYHGVSSSLGIPTQQAAEHYPHSDMSITKTIDVRVVNLGSVLTQCWVTHIDHLRIDAQGMDLEILKSVERWLRTHDIDTLRTEADAEGFQHYEGMENSAQAQLEYMKQFDYIGRVPKHNEYGGQWVHGNIDWRVNNSQIEWFA